MNVFYNKEGIGDTLIVCLTDLPSENRGFEKKGQAVRIYDKDSNETAGYNLFSASEYGPINSAGVVKVTEELVSLVNRAIADNGFDETINFDGTPDFVVGFVLEKTEHPDADKLSVCKVDVGSEEIQIVCGAPNVEVGQKVVVARVGAVMPSGTIIKDANLRGVDSFGMICAARELDLPNAPQKKGILVLPEDYEVGEDFFEQRASLELR
ncbi:MAG TPA: DUF4479 domain-containing protein [Bacillales bacterium]|nr:DUF4479 domain-containing protein [Bacillales bacterium]